eukprot:SAG31_NODE_9235_length_1311_cov_4.424092_1_plen_65_part_00
MAAVDHELLLYMDGGVDGNGAKGEWGNAGFGVSVREVGGGEYQDRRVVVFFYKDCIQQDPIQMS